VLGALVLALSLDNTDAHGAMVRTALAQDWFKIGNVISMTTPTAFAPACYTAGVAPEPSHGGGRASVV